MNRPLKIIVSLPLLVAGCAPGNPSPSLYVPALKYAGNADVATAKNGLEWRGALEESTLEDGRMQMRLARGRLIDARHYELRRTSNKGLPYLLWQMCVPAPQTFESSTVQIALDSRIEDLYPRATPE